MLKKDYKKKNQIILLIIKMKLLFLLNLLILICITEAVMVENNGTWQLISEFALGVWKYANVTSLLPTIPHS